LLSLFFYGKRAAKFLKMFRKGPVNPECRSLPLSSLAGNL
jgi:hypothetical protein